MERVLRRCKAAAIFCGKACPDCWLERSSAVVSSTQDEDTRCCELLSHACHSAAERGNLLFAHESEGASGKQQIPLLRYGMTNQDEASLGC